MTDRQEKVAQIAQVFGQGGDITQSVISTVFDAHHGDVDATIDELLNMTNDVTGASPAASPSSSFSAKSDDSEEKGADKHQEARATLHAIFAGDLTRSVIDIVYAQNAGDVAQAVDTLLNVYHDPEALEAIRDMGLPQQKELELEMAKEQLLRNAERKKQMELEIAEEHKRLADIERRAKEEAEKRVREQDALIARLKVQREQEQKERELLEKHRQELEKQSKELAQARDDAVRKLQMEKLEAERRAQKEREERLLKEVERQIAERKKAEEEEKAAAAALAKEINEKKEELKAKEFLVSRIIQEAALVTLGVRYSDKTIVVSWSLGPDMQAQANDWIGFYKVGQPNDRYREYIKTNGERTGHHAFRAPKTPGLYAFKFFAGGGYKEVASSDVLHLGPQVALSVKLVQPTDLKSTESGSVEVQCTLTSGEISPSDWIGLYDAAEKSNKSYLKLKYLKPLAGVSVDVKDAPQTVLMSFPAPRTPGDYIVRFFPARCKYTATATSNRIRVTNRDVLTVEVIKDPVTDRATTFKVVADIFSVEPSSSDYVAVYQKDAANNSYLSYVYYDRKKGFAELPAPTAVGEYNVRFHSPALTKYVDIAKSSTIHIIDTDWVKAEVAGGILSVCWDIHSQPRSTWDWVGIFPVGASNTSYVAYKYVDVGNALTFEVPSNHGRFEARYFSYNLGKYTDFRKSAPFMIA